MEIKAVDNYFKNLVNMFFKILPMKENNVETLTQYMVSLRSELIGFKSAVPCMESEPMILSLISNLQYMIDYPELHQREVRSQVFNAISICNKLRSRYSVEEVR